MSELNYVKSYYNLKAFEEKHQLVESIKKRIEQIPNYEELRKNPLVDIEFVKLITNCIENIVSKGSKINKKDLCILVFKEIFPDFSQEECDNIGNVIEFIHQNGLIKKVPFFRKIKRIIKNYLKKKFM